MHTPLNHTDLKAFVAEAAEYNLVAHIEYPGFVAVTDHCGRVLHIGDANGPWAVDVYRNITEVEQGVSPSYSEELQGDDVRVRFNHALLIAARVALPGVK